MKKSFYKMHGLHAMRPTVYSGRRVGAVCAFFTFLILF